MVDQLQQQSLFDRLGGVPAVRAVINEFYNRILDDQRLAFFFHGAQMASLKMHQLRFLKIALTEIPKDLDVAALLLEKHIRLFDEKGLNEMHFDLVAEHLLETLVSFNVPQDLIDETIAIVAPLRPIFQQGADKYGLSVKYVKDKCSPEHSSKANNVRRRVSVSQHTPSTQASFQPEDSFSSDGEESFSGSSSFVESSVDRVPSTITATTTPTPQEEETLTERLGGAEALKAVVEELYHRLTSDKMLKPFFQGVNMGDLKRHQFYVMKRVTDGKVTAQERLDIAVRKAHQRLFLEMGLNARHFDRLVEHLVITLKKFHVSRKSMDELLGILAPMRDVFELGTFETQQIEV